MNVKELASQIVEANSASLSSVPEQKIRLVIRETLRLIKTAVDETETGSVGIDTLGQFKVRLAEVERDGAQTTVRRVAFNSAKKAPQAEGGGAGGPAAESA